MRLKALLAQRLSLRSEFKTWLDGVLATAGTEGRGLTAEEDAKQKDYQAKLAAQDQLIAGEELAASLAPPPTTVLDAGPVDPSRVEVGPANILNDPFRGFHEGSRFAMGEFAIAVKGANTPGTVVDRRLVEGGLMAAPSNYHQTTGAEGAMIPTAVSTSIMELVFQDPVLGLINVEPTDKPVVSMLADQTTPWGATGIQASWRAEGTQMSPSKLVTDPRQVRVQELYAFVLATEELLEDAPRLTDRINRKAPQAIQWKLVESFISGTGAGQPLGWFSTNYSGKVSVTRSGANLIAVADVTKMFERLLVQDGVDNSFWLVNRTTLPQLMTMVIGQQPVWHANMAVAPGGVLLGRPVYFSEHCEPLGTAGDIHLVNPAGYMALARGSAQLETSIHLYFDYAMTAYRLMTRFGGMPLLSAVVTPPKATASTKAHFITLS